VATVGTPLVRKGRALSCSRVDGGPGCGRSKGLLTAESRSYTVYSMGRKKTRERIAEAARRLLEDEGPGAVSMRRVAKLVGITPMAIYHHFPNRGTLLKTIADREFERILGRIEVRGRGTPISRLLGVMDSYIADACARPKIFECVFSRMDRLPNDLPRSPTLDPVADAVARAMERGYLRKDDPWEVAVALWALAHGYTALFRAGRLAPSERRFRLLYRRSMRRLFRGLQASDAPSVDRVEVIP
jgi:AcrR family transcriptional regulator